ncbi:MAG: GatB/YqeY domain-containing protein [Flavobacteriales bacterium]|nr:GatB/YqeY domain-containing protein [Flavobacteriales bacterium]MDG1781588.1 GatB/YqeY domain-containing protein [Flavobacteriales bacterium]
MSITDKINNDIKAAMKARETAKLSALRDIKSKLLLEMTKDGADGGVDESAGMKVLNKLYKQRTEAAKIYQEQGREDLYAEEMEQAEVIKAYLPAQLTPEEIEVEVKAIIDATGASSMADMGKVMGAASGKMAGKADGKVISEIVKRLLS